MYDLPQNCTLHQVGYCNPDDLRGRSWLPLHVEVGLLCNALYKHVTQVQTSTNLRWSGRGYTLYCTQFIVMGTKSCCPKGLKVGLTHVLHRKWKQLHTCYTFPRSLTPGYLVATSATCNNNVLVVAVLVVNYWGVLYTVLSEGGRLGRWNVRSICAIQLKVTPTDGTTLILIINFSTVVGTVRLMESLFMLARTPQLLKLLSAYNIL